MRALSNPSVLAKRLIGVLVLHTGIALNLCAADGPKIGDLPPPLQLGAVLQGPPKENVNWDALKGKVIAVEFWNTACAPCVAAIPHWNELAARFAAEGVVFISI